MYRAHALGSLLATARAAGGGAAGRFPFAVLLVASVGVDAGRLAATPVEHGVLCVFQGVHRPSERSAQNHAGLR
jgi:hypothetical protein